MSGTLRPACPPWETSVTDGKEKQAGSEPRPCQSVSVKSRWRAFTPRLISILLKLRSERNLLVPNLLLHSVKRQTFFITFRSFICNVTSSTSTSTHKRFLKVKSWIVQMPRYVLPSSRKPFKRAAEGIVVFLSRIFSIVLMRHEGDPSCLFF